MNLLKSATQDGGLNAVAAIEIKQRLNELSTFPWENGDFEQTNIFKAAKKLTKASIFGDEIAEMASKLIARWKQNRFSPFQLDSGEEMVDSTPRTPQTAPPQDESYANLA
ncbi:hypothetical protein BDZ91DRAFT_97763 [Kalaharituber pfeilii]|nr:hypothetical protein BDZ91DRAFT_97763 [Kalaharituber pfeilii]